MTKEEVINNLKDIAESMPSDACWDWIACIDFSIRAIQKLDTIEGIVRDHDADSHPEDFWYIDKIKEMLK